MEETQTGTASGTTSPAHGHVGMHREALHVMPLLSFALPNASCHDKNLQIPPLPSPFQALAAAPVPATSQRAAKARRCVTARCWLTVPGCPAHLQVVFRAPETASVPVLRPPVSVDTLFLHARNRTFLSAIQQHQCSLFFTF